MNQEYYGSDNAPFADLADATSGIELTEQMVIEAARRIYDNQASASELDVQMYEAVLASFHNAIAEGLADAVSSGTGAVSDEFLEQLRSSNEVFATFKVHRMQRDIASQLFTAEGKLKSRSRFVKDVLPVASHHVKAWLRTEYDTAVLRAHQAADWLQFERDKDVLPNLRWMPSTSITPGEDHRVFWNTVLPIEHRFWSVHRPGDRWNCKCRLEATDDAPTAVPSIEKNDKKNNPARGLENNPAKDGHIFSNKHSYFPSSCSTCPYGTKKGNLFALVAKKKGDCYACENIDKSKESMRKKENRKEYERLKKDPHFVDVHYDKKSGGVKATHKGHNEQKEITKLGISSTELEKNCQDILYRKGYRVIFTNENMVDSKGNTLSQLDMMLDGKPCDIASITTNRRHFGETLFKKNRQVERFNKRDDIQIKANSVCLYFHDETMFSHKKILRSINHYKYRRKSNGELIAHHIKTIYCVIKGKSKDEIITFVVE